MDFTLYQTALIVILVLNLFFWIFAICFRLFFKCYCEDNCVRVRSRTGRRRRNRREAVIRRQTRMGVRNQAFDDQESLPSYGVATELEAPPPYEDAVKLPISRISSSKHDMQIAYHTFPRTNYRTRPRMYEQTVTLMVPEDSTSSSEARFLTSLNEYPSSLTNTQGTCSVGLNPASDRVCFESFVGIMECTDDRNSEDIPFTFVVDGIGPQSAMLLGITNTTAVLEDGADLASHSKA